MPAKAKKLPFNFCKILLKWNRDINKRQMPWKGEKDPYRVWLSEIILQQTRVVQGLKYYKNFIKAFPDVHALAHASDQKVYKLWEGLGYYTRCRNLIETARYISKDLQGRFPSHHEEIKKLKGVGPYTAAAVSSFAFNEPIAVVDGNVFRVLARIFGILKAIDTTEGKRFFTGFANDLLDKQQPGIYNQAIMDFGAVICKPTPLCQQCPFSNYCRAYLDDNLFLFPVKSRRRTIRKRWFNYILLEYRSKFAIHQRTQKDIWHNLFEFLLIESPHQLDQKGIAREIKKTGWVKKNGIEAKYVSPIYKQQLSHQLIEGSFTRLRLQEKPVLRENVLWVKEAEITNYAFPKLINQYLKKDVSLNKEAQ